jgi:uncharacterized protein involved in outer membrane biogenesis
MDVQTVFGCWTNRLEHRVPMSKPLKIGMLIAGVMIGLVALVAAALFLFVDVDTYRPQLETAASDALGMEVSIAGTMGIELRPGLLITLKDVRIADHGREFATIPQVKLGVGLLALLQKQIRIGEVTLKQPKVTLDPELVKHFNRKKPEAVANHSTDFNWSNVAVSDGSLQFVDKQSGEKYAALDCGLAVNHLRLPAPGPSDPRQILSFAAELTCGTFEHDDFTVSDVKFSVAGTNGIIDVTPVTLKIFGSQSSGSVHADFSGDDPRYDIHFDLPQFLVAEFFKTLSPQKVAEGVMDFTAKLSTHGETVNEMKQAMTGTISLRGEQLVVHGRDLDQEFSRFESSQSFNLVDVGALFIAGPFGLMVTKGYNFASILQGPGGSSEIRSLVSDWRIEHGVAQAQDVALATSEHRVALHGGLDFVNEKFDDVTVALLDAEGCAKVRQTIRGRFQDPVVEQPSLLKSLTGPARKLIQIGKDLFPGNECEVFYRGSVTAKK